MDAIDDGSDVDLLERGGSEIIDMVDDNAHCRWDFGVIECCIRIVYPPAAADADALHDFVSPPFSALEDTTAGCGRVADEKSASQGFDDEEGLDLLMLRSICGGGKVGVGGGQWQ
mmetsp:Transcript_44492/g.79812  ORF Transcript_44492/g.79812 Transcript_44492/m.79812 type:complete len:115 (+) Transcript_44492:324-668(+)